ncbi:hypothetical protein SLS62_000473 [Diatrype stigma]|uniref:Uncharacterized protein n=1 Tax=Diatrype stigma TaxID=117547 RepID=A0AAN9YSJ7_9PEZI
MRLLHAKSKRLHEFFDRDIPPFAILSHVWGTEEVTYEDVKRRWPWYKRKAGYRKIKGCCRQALDDEIEYVWIDSCCIDRSSSAELSEAINSMFVWYRESIVCYAYLADVPDRDDVFGEGSAFRRSQWFQRGWTLQELLAPGLVWFFDRKWRPLGTKAALWSVIQDATGIGQEYLGGTNLDRASIAQRMSWAAKRETTRKEDKAYCLLGIFGVHMPMLYGEGDRAFIRLQEEIIKSSGDHSILAWGYNMPVVDYPSGGILAHSPFDFLHCGNVIADRWPGNLRSSHFVATNMGLRIELPVGVEDFTETQLAVLNCTTEKHYIALPLTGVEGTEDKFERLHFCQPTLVAPRTVGGLSLKEFYLQEPVAPMWKKNVYLVCTLVLHQLGFCLKTAYPPHAISKITLRGGPGGKGDMIEYIWIYQGARAMLEIQAPGGDLFTIGVQETDADPPGLEYKMAPSTLADLINVSSSLTKSALSVPAPPPQPAAAASSSSSAAMPRAFPHSLGREAARWAKTLTLDGLEVGARVTEETSVYGASATLVLEMVAKRPTAGGGGAGGPGGLVVVETSADDTAASASSDATHVSFTLEDEAAVPVGEEEGESPYGVDPSFQLQQDQDEELSPANTRDQQED